MISCLKNLARNHSIAIVTSIHQPNTDVLMLFDQLYVLSNVGQCVYNGHSSYLKQHLIECQVSLLNYQVPIEQLIKVASSNDSAKYLVSKTNDNSIIQKELCTKFGELIKASFSQKKKFSLNDLLILLRRTINNEFIGGWKIQFGFIFVLLFCILLVLYLLPNDIGSDPGCPLDVIELANISLINQRILDALTGDQQKYQQNIRFIYFVLVVIYSLNMIQVCYSAESQVIFKNSKIL